MSKYLTKYFFLFNLIIISEALYPYYKLALGSPFPNHFPHTFLMLPQNSFF